MPKKYSLDIIEAILTKQYPDQVFDFSRYENTSSKIKVIDSKYGEWFPSVKNLLSKKRKCRKRQIAESSQKKRISINEAKRRINKIHKGFVVLDDITYIDAKTKCRFIDKEFGEFWMIPRHVFNGSGHKKRGILKQIQSSILPIDEVKIRLKAIHGNEIKIDTTTYCGMYNRARFIHKKYGNWWATPNNVIEKVSSHPDGSKKRSIATSLKKYGTANPMQNINVFKKASRSRWKTVTLFHWKTNDEVICMSSFEYAIVNYLNNNKIDYSWQIKTILSNGMVYFIDLYLKEDDKFIEIKGYFFSEKSKLKWELFHRERKNSEIWFVDKISTFVSKNQGIIKKEFKDAWSKKVKRCME